MHDIFARPRAERFISHRGFQPMAPANSLPGFAYSGLLHQWAIETDVHRTADGVLVCCHDATVDSIYGVRSGVTGAIAEMTWDALSRLKIEKGKRLDCFPCDQLRMPRFSEYLAICRRYGSVPFIELKTDDVAEVIAAVHAAGFADDEVVMSSSNLDRLIETRRHAPDMFIHWIFACEERLDELAALGNAGLSWNIPDCFTCPPEKIEMAHARGLKVCLRAADTRESVRHMLDLGLDYLPSNCMHAYLNDDLDGGAR